MPNTKEYSRQYYLSHLDWYRNYYLTRREKIRVNQKEYKLKHPDRVEQQQQKYRKRVKEKDKLHRRQRLLDAKTRLVELIGGKCQKCGDSDIRHLVFHHRNGGGQKNRMGLHRTAYYQRLIKDSEARAELDLLCANCHSELHQG